MTKRITGLGQTITTLSGAKVLIQENLPLTIKDAIVTICEMTKSQIAGETLKAYAIGAKIYTSKDTVDLSEEEITSLRKLINESNVFVATVIGRLIEVIDSAKEVKDK